MGFYCGQKFPLHQDKRLFNIFFKLNTNVINWCFFTSIVIPSYVYTYIKIGFLQKLIIEEENLSVLKKFDKIEEFMEFISPYYPEIKISDYSIIEIEHALFHTLIKLIGKILYFSPENMKLFLKAYLLKYEIANIKQIILGSIIGISKSEKSERVNFLVEEYLERSDFIKDLLEITNLEEIQLFLKNTRYNKPIREGIQYFKNTKEIFVLEAFLDKLYYENLILTKNFYDKKEKAMISLFINYSTEVYNLRILSRAIRNNFDKNLTSQLLIKNYLFFNQERIDTLLKISNINDFISEVQKYLNSIKELKDLFVSIDINKKHLRWSFEGIYQNYYFKKFQLKIDDFEYFTIYRILELIIKKEKEIKFNIMPNVIGIINEKYESLKDGNENF